MEKERVINMAGKIRPSLRIKTLSNVMLSDLSTTDKNCIVEVFERYSRVVRCCECKYLQKNLETDGSYSLTCNKLYGLQGVFDLMDYCSYGERVVK